MSQQEELSQLAELAVRLGASAAVLAPAACLVLAERFADLCAGPPRCPSYGLAPGCPPHAERPELFGHRLAEYTQMVVFKIDVPAEDLMGAKRLPVARAIHRIAAGVERAALARGLRASGLAAGSCKELFCSEHPLCAVLHQSRPCRRPDAARPSLSAVGVDFTALAASVGWSFGNIVPGQATGAPPAMGLLAGLVLLG